MRKITTDELFDVLRYETEGRFYSVTFERRTTRRNRTARAGELRTMLCKTGAEMSSYKLGVISTEARDEEDLRTGTITVWSMDAYTRLRKMGWPHENAAWNSWRRIDLMGIKECSLIDDEELPPTYRPAYHHVTNRYRLAHMPRVSQARSVRE